MDDLDTPLHEHPQYLRARLAALEALLHVLARLTTDPHSYREEGMQALELLRTALLSAPVSEAQLLAIDAAEKELVRVTA